MATDLNKEKFDILNFINGYIISICGNCHKRIRNLLKNFSIKISSSAEGSVGFLGVERDLNVQAISSSAKGCIGMFEVNTNSNIGPVNVLGEAQTIFGISGDSDIGPISSSAVGLVVQE